MVNSNKGRFTKVLKGLQQVALDGRKINLKELSQDESVFGKIRTIEQAIAAKKIARGFVVSLKGRLRRKFGLWFGSLDDQGNYGIVVTEGEARHAGTGYYKLIKGSLHNYGVLADNSEKNNLLTFESEKISLPKPEGTNE